MKMIAEKLGKADRYDRLRFIRADASEATISMPRQGTLPHDLIHYVVESALPLRHGFLSLVAGGADPSFAMDIVHDATRVDVELEAIQAEAVVEALQTQLWGGAFDLDAFRYAVDSATAARGRPSFDFSATSPERALYEPALALLERWQQVPFHQTLELDFAGGSAPRAR
ncbi:MAG TPA: hypothetical protein VI258_05105 [Rhodanobacteraceae bacterium]